ncbi:putative PEP-binding protein [Altericista sp. CCNU0014]|uniref:putative PEP-binding protein n=1 Tax=Altericista sp. CCNU0014 TaxID=3082949 RepID=UPI0038513EDA
MDSLLWLDRLQETDETQAGTQLANLSQLFQTCPGENGWIVPDGVMQAIWQQIDWPNEILQDFPYLNLNVSLSQPAQVQSIAQTLQRGILTQSLPPTWADEWQQGLDRWPKPPLMLTPYLWTDPKERSGEASSLLFSKPSLCDSDLASFWERLKAQWAQLFQARSLHILGHLGLRPEQLHLSVLVQPLGTARAFGWLKIGHDALALEAVSQVSLEPWQGERWPDCYLYDRHRAQWLECFTSCSSPARAIQYPNSASAVKPDLLSEDTLQALVEMAASVPLQTYAETPLTLTWVLPDTLASATPKILGFVPDLPLPLHPSLQSPSRNEFDIASLRSVDRDSAPVPIRMGLGAFPGSITAPVIVVQSFEDLSPAACRGKILVVRHLEPIHLPWLQEAVGLLCETGGIASHGAILARELGCPAIVGLSDITKALQTGQRVSFNGKEGKIYGLDVEDPDPAPSVSNSQGDNIPKRLSTSIQLLASVSQLTHLKKAQAQEIDGIGLVRGEWLLLSQITSVDALNSLTKFDREHFGSQIGATLAAMAQAVSPRPIYYRSIDWSSAWGKQSSPRRTEQNSNLGLRGTLRYRHDPQLFELELAMLAELLNRGIENLRLILPFVRSPQEVAFCTEKMRAAGIDPDNTLPLWIMAEVPSVLFSLKQYRQVGVRGIAIGSNDLAQLLLGIDRDRAAFMDILNQNRAVLEDAVRQLVREASALELSSILCGDLLLDSQPNYQWLGELIEAGLGGISVDAGAIAATREAIARAEQQLRVKPPTTSSKP